MNKYYSKLYLTDILVADGQAQGYILWRLKCVHDDVLDGEK